jgi:[acyl-carrier-protein] S-malonyltransferase
MRKIAFLFPGQGSQTVGMGHTIAEVHQPSAEIFHSADQKLGYSLSKLIFEGPQEKLTLTTNAQPALLATSIALLEYFKESGITPDYCSGHSLGEYTALVASGAFSFEEGVYAVHKRGEFMEIAVPNGEGTMAAVLGLDSEKLKAVTDEITSGGNLVQLANINCPGQIVISGTRKGVELASVKAKEAGAKRVLPLEVSGPFHSELMKPAANKLETVLDDMDIQDAKVPVIANVTAEEMSQADDIKAKLIQQLYSPVQWEKSVQKMLDLGVTTFIEIGPGKVLSGLVKKVNRRVTTYAVSDEITCKEVIEAIKEGSK